MSVRPSRPFFRKVVLVSTKPLKNPAGPEGVMANYIFPSGGRGLDVDLLLKHKKYGWVIMEFLRCQTSKVDVLDAHPNRYMWGPGGNWRKFVRLWQLAKATGGVFVLVNYETLPPLLPRCPGCHREVLKGISFGKVGVIFVDMDVDPRERQRLVNKHRANFPCFEDFAQWFRKFDSESEELYLL